MRIERWQSTDGSKNTSIKHIHIAVPGTWYFASDLVLLCVRTKAQRSTTKHRTRGQGSYIQLR